MSEAVSSNLPAARPSRREFENALDAVWSDLERQRRKAISALWITSLRCLIGLPIAVTPAVGFFLLTDATMSGSLAHGSIELGESAGPLMPFILIGSFGWFIGWLWLLGRYFVCNGRQPGWDYLRDYKRKVFTRVCKISFPSLTYDPTAGIGWQTLDDSRLFPWTSDWYRSEDYFSGRIGNTDIRFAEAWAKRERKRLSKDGFETYLDPYFGGMIFVADFHKHFHSTTRLIPAGEKVDRIWRQKIVELEDPEFQKRFVTTSSDQIDVRYILSTSMMRRLLDVYRRFPGLRAQFHRDQLLLLLPHHHDRFEPSLYARADSMSQVSDFIRDVEALLPIVEELNLNTRIWSKR